MIRTKNHKNMIQSASSKTSNTITPYQLSTNYEHYFKFKLYFIGSVVTGHTLNTSNPYDIHSNTYYLTGNLIRVKVESWDWYEVVGVNHT